MKSIFILACLLMSMPVFAGDIDQNEEIGGDKFSQYQFNENQIFEIKYTQSPRNQCRGEGSTCGYDWGWCCPGLSCRSSTDPHAREGACLK